MLAASSKDPEEPADNTGPGGDLSGDLSGQRSPGEDIADAASRIEAGRAENGAGKEGEDPDGTDLPQLRAWGLVAARLGRKQNRGAFRTEFWFGEADPVTRKVLDDGVPGMQKRLERWRDGTDPHPSRAEA